MITTDLNEKLRSLLSAKDDASILKNTTNEEWQEILQILKSTTLPSRNRILVRSSKTGYIVQRKWSLTDNEYACETQDAWFVKFINDVLRKIRSGKKSQIDHVYHVYQIKELLKYEPELQAELIHSKGMDYFEVWLTK